MNLSIQFQLLIKWSEGVSSQKVYLGKYLYKLKIINKLPVINNNSFILIGNLPNFET